MPKPYTFPTLYDECKRIDISNLKRWGYLKYDHQKWGTITWSRNGEKTGWIDIRVYMLNYENFLELDYKCNERPIKYRVQLVSIPSNLGKGEVWYFLCPVTGKRCRKLFLIGNKFLHREAYSGCLYESQTYSKNWRGQKKYYDTLFGSDKVYDEIYGKHFRTHYNGKPTKRYIRLLKKLREGE